MLRKNQIKLRCARGVGDHPFQKKWVGEIFEVAQLRVTAHLPFCKLMQTDLKLFLHVFRIGDLRAEDVDVVPATNHFPDQINRLRRTAAARC